MHTYSASVGTTTEQRLLQPPEPQEPRQPTAPAAFALVLRPKVLQGTGVEAAPPPPGDLAVANAQMKASPPDGIGA